MLLQNQLEICINLMKFCSIVANMLDWNIVVSKFELQSQYYVHFQINILGERYEPSYSLRYGLNGTTSVLLQGWI